MTEFRLSDSLRQQICAQVSQSLEAGEDLLADLCDDARGEWSALFLAAAKEAHAAGLVRPFTNENGHDAFSADLWNRFVCDGAEALADWQARPVGDLVLAHVMVKCSAFLRDPSGAARAARPHLDPIAASILARNEGVEPPIDQAGPEHAGRITAMLIRELTAPSQQLIQSTPAEAASSHDGRMIDITFDGWRPVVVELIPPKERERDMPRYRISDPVSPEPPIRHYEIAVPSGRLAVFSSSDTHKAISSALRQAGVKGIELPRDFSANTGANSFTLGLFEKTGALGLHLGDHFPGLIRDRTVLRGLNAGSEEAREAGLEPLSRGALDQPVFMDLGDLARLIDHPDRSRSERDGLIYDMEMGQDILVIDVPDRHMHLYAPDGWRATGFSEVAIWPDKTAMPQSEDYFLLSETPLDLPEGLMTHVDMPDRPRPDPEDVPDYGTGPV